MINKIKRYIVSIMGAVLPAVVILAGCASVGPDYTEPEIKMPEEWSSKTDEGKLAEADPKVLADWWTLFNDPVLTNLVERAVENNLDVKAAAAKVKQVRLKRRTAAADLYPSVSATGSGSVTGRENQQGSWDEQESYGTGLDVSWEIDIFGGTRREMEAAMADYQAAREDLRDVLVSLTAETATAYVQLRIYQKQLEVTRENLRLQEEAADLTRIKYETGLAGALAAEQSTYNVESTRSQIPELESNIEEMKNRLAVLLGGWPGDLNEELSATAPIPSSALKAAIGAPADLLRRRPDIRSAERRLAAETARIGVAEADLYPKLTLNGSLGWDAAALSSLISPANLVAVLGAGISWKIFNTGSVRANIEIQNATQEQALIEYEAVLHTAVEEVENSVTSIIKEAGKQESLKKAYEAARNAAGLALQEYQTGLSDFQNVLETQQSLMSFQEKLTDSRGRSTLNMIVMYKALGGGWSPDQVKAN